MSTTSPISNVYYLTPPAPRDDAPRPSHGPALRRRLLAFWWRLRLTTAEIAATLRRFGASPIESDAAFLEQQADLILALPRPAAGPARIIDFAAARTRLRA